MGSQENQEDQEDQIEQRFQDEIVDINLNDIEAKEVKQQIDWTAYEGKRLKIESGKDANGKDLGIVIKKVRNYYPNGSNVYDPTSQEMKYVVYIYTEPVPKLDENGEFTNEAVTYKDKDGNVFVKRAHVRFNLAEDKETGKPYVSKNDKAKLWKFLCKRGANKDPKVVGKSYFDQLKGLYVPLGIEVRTDDNGEKKLLVIAQ